MLYRIAYGLAATFWLMLCVNNVMHRTSLKLTGNPNFDTGAQVGGWLFSGFIVYAVLHCSWKAIRGPRVVASPTEIDAPLESSEVDDASSVGSAPEQSSVNPPSKEFDRDSDITRHVLENDREHPSNRIYFLTLTPRDEWGDNGAWQDVPTTLLEAMPSITSEYRPAHGAYLKGNHVIEKETEKEAWMKWVSITRWHSDTEVEVEQGVWCRPSNGGASTVIYEKQGGKWEFKSLVRSWVS